MKAFAAIVIAILFVFLWRKTHKKSRYYVLGDGFSVKFSARYKFAVVDYREGGHKLSWYGELGARRSKNGRYSAHLWIPNEPSFDNPLSLEETAPMVDGDMTLLRLPRTVSLPAKLSETRVIEIKDRISTALDQMGLEPAFSREGRVSFDSANKIVDS